MLIERWRTHDAAARRPPKRILAESDELLDGLFGTDENILVGPVVARPDGARPQVPAWYFTVASADRAGFFCALVGADDRDEAEWLHWTVVTRLLQRRPKVVVHQFPDELMMARLAVALWPGERTRSILKDIEAERRKRH